MKPKESIHNILHPSAPLAAPAQGETPLTDALELQLEEIHPRQVKERLLKHARQLERELNAAKDNYAQTLLASIKLEGVISDLRTELAAAKVDVLRGIQRDAARLVEDTARAGELATLRQQLAQMEKERDEARGQWRMSSVCRELQSRLTAAESELAELRTCLRDLLFVYENADETGYVADVGFVKGFDEIPERCRAAMNQQREGA